MDVTQFPDDRALAVKEIPRWRRARHAMTDLQISQSTLYKLKDSGAIKTARRNGTVWFDVGGFLQSLEDQPDA